MDKQSPVARIWELGADEHGKLIAAVALAMVGVVCGMIPYFAAARLLALLLSLAVFPIAFFFMMTAMGGYTKDYEGAVQATNEMSGAMIEYINDIEVIKAFNQGKKSYARAADGSDQHGVPECVPFRRHH